MKYAIVLLAAVMIFMLYGILVLLLDKPLYKLLYKNKYGSFEDYKNAQADKTNKFFPMHHYVFVAVSIAVSIYFLPTVFNSLTGSEDNTATIEQKKKDINEFKFIKDGKEYIGKKGDLSAAAIKGISTEKRNSGVNLQITVLIKNLSTNPFYINCDDFKMHDNKGNNYKIATPVFGTDIQPNDEKEVRLGIDLPVSCDVSSLILVCSSELTGLLEEYELPLNNAPATKKGDDSNKQKTEKDVAVNTLIAVLNEVSGNFDSNTLDKIAFNEHRTPVGERTIPYLQEVNQRIKTTIEWNSNQTGIKQKVKYKLWRVYKADDNNYQMDVDIHMGENGVSLKNITVRKINDNEFKVDLETLAMAFLEGGV